MFKKIMCQISEPFSLIFFGVMEELLICVGFWMMCSKRPSVAYLPVGKNTTVNSEVDKDRSSGLVRPAKIKNKNNKSAHVQLVTHTIVIIMNAKDKNKHKVKITATNIKI